MAESIDATIREIRHQGRSFDGGTFVIAKIDGGQSVVGDLHDPRVGETYRFFGEWSVHPRFGRQYKFTTAEVIVDMSTDGVTQYLRNYIDGLGLVKASAIVEHFGVDTLTILRENPEAALAVHRITPEIVEAIRTHFDDAAMGDPATEAKLLEMFRGVKFPRRIIKQLMRAYRASAVDRLMGNPYLLLQFRGVGWKLVDSFATTVAQYARDGIARHRGAIKEAFETLANDGHTCHTMAKVNEIAGGLLGMPVLQSAWAAMAQAGEVVAHVGTDEEKAAGKPRMVALARYADAELEVARRLARLLDEGLPLPGMLSIDGLAEEQAEAVKVIQENGVAILTGAPGTGKAQPLNSIVYTTTGPKLMGEISVGDQVIGSDGTGHSVTGVFPQGYLEVYAITFDDGARVECCEDHLWSVQTPGRRNGKGNSTVLSLKQVESEHRRVTGQENRKGKHSSLYFPIVKEIQFQRRELPLDPYLLGLLLGDGSMVSGSCRFTTIDGELLESVGRLVPDGINIVPAGNGKDYRLTWSHRPRENPLTFALRSLGLWGCRSNDKFIPEDYKFSSVADRVAILNGLLDTDGFADRSSVEYTSVSEKLAKDVQFIVESLGGKARIASRIPVYSHLGEKKEGQRSYRMWLSLPNHIRPFRLSRKANANKARKSRHPVRTIRSIDYVGIKDCQCISVDSSDQLYVTDNCVLTHNTYTTAKILGNLIDLGVPAQSMTFLAPTGKASRRGAELLNDNGIKGISCSTIHKALAPSPCNSDQGAHGDDAKSERGRESFGFLRNESNPLPYSYIVVSECSMLDVKLAACLLRAVKPGTRLLIEGDENQLPSVGAGSFLRDLLAAGLPSFTLKEIRRSDSAGAAVHACHAILRGQMPEFSDCVDLPRKNLIHLEVEDPMAIADTIIQLHRTAKTFDPVADMQVVTPQKTRHPFGTEALNRRLSALLNPVAAEAMEEAESSDDPDASNLPQYFIGDKVIRTENGLAKEMVAEREWAAEQESVEECDRKEWNPTWSFRGVRYAIRDAPIVNGDMGTILDIVKVGSVGMQVVVELKAPDRLVRLPHADSKLIQAYAMTTHRCQGSGFDYVVIPVHQSIFAGLMTREMFYTQTSRIKKIGVIVGPKAAIESAIGRKTVHLRQTRLATLLRVEMDEVRAGRRRWAERDEQARQEREQQSRHDQPAPRFSRPTPASCLGVLGLAPPVTLDAVKSRFRELAKSAHPDGGGTHEGFVAVRRAYAEAVRMVRA